MAISLMLLMGGVVLGTILTLDEVAELLGLEKVRVEKWLEKGFLPGRKIQGQWRIEEEALNQFLAKGPNRPRDRVEQWVKDNFKDVIITEYRLKPYGIKIFDKESDRVVIAYWDKEAKKVKTQWVFDEKK